MPDLPPSVAIVLPPREAYCPAAAGAVALVAERLARASSWRTTVIGRAVPGPFAGFVSVARRVPYVLGVLIALWRLRPDVVEVHNRPRLARVLAWRHLRVTLMLHNDPVGMRGMRTPAARARLGGSLAGIAAVSSWVAERARPAVVVVLPNGVDLPAGPNADARERIVLFAGRVVADKGADVFVAAVARALPEMPGWRAVMVGADRFGPDSPDTAFLRALRSPAEAAGIEMLGYRPQPEVASLLARASIVVVPSVWPEPFGLVALEAMAAGAALIHTGAGGLTELVGDGGLVVPPGDVAALARAIATQARKPPQMRALAAAGRLRAAQFALPLVAGRIDAWRRSALDRLPPRRRRPIPGGTE